MNKHISLREGYILKNLRTYFHHQLSQLIILYFYRNIPLNKLTTQLILKTKMY